MAGIAGMGTPKALARPVPNEAPQIDLSNVAQVPDVASMKVEAPAPAESDSGIDPDILAFAQGDGGDSEIDPDILAFAGGESSDGNASVAEESEAAMNPDSEAPGLMSQIMDVGKDIANPVGTLMNLATGEPTNSGKHFEDAGTRLKASIPKTDKERRFVLEQAYGAENVKKAKDGFLFKKDGKWRKFDKSGWEVVNDIMDLGGDAIEQGATEAGTALGLTLATGEAAAAPVTGGASLFAVPGTVAAARGAGALAGTGTRDLLQASMGIPRDGERSATMEYGANAVMNAAFGRLGDWASMKIASRAAAKADEILHAPEEILQDEIKLTHEASQVLKDSGLYHEDLSLLETIPGSAEARDVFEKIAKHPYTREIITLKNQAFANANKMFLDSISKFTGNIEGKITKVGQRVGKFIDETRKAEGKLIGDYRKSFLEQAGSGELPVPQLQQKVDEIAGQLGFQVKDNQLVVPSVDQLQEMGYSKESAENLSRLVEKLHTKLFNQEGRVNAKELNALYEQWSGLTDNLWTRGEGADKAYRKTVTQIKDAIRDAYTDKIGVVLDGNEGYKKALGEFSFIEKNRKQIEDILDKDKISSIAFAKHIFSKGADGLDDLRAVKAVLKNRPELFDELTGQFYADIVRKHMDMGSGKVAWNKVNKEIGGLGTEMLEEMMGKDAIKKLNAFQVIGENLGKVSAIGGLTGPQQASIVKNLTVAASEGSGFGAGNAVIQMLSQSDHEKALFSSLKKEGIDAFLRTAPENKKKLLSKILQGYLDMQDTALKSRAAQGFARGVGTHATRPAEKEEN